jgi:hypothetical protein
VATSGRLNPEAGGKNLRTIPKANKLNVVTGGATVDVTSDVTIDVTVDDNGDVTGGATGDAKIIDRKTEFNGELICLSRSSTVVDRRPR